MASLHDKLNIAKNGGGGGNRSVRENPHNVPTYTGSVEELDGIFNAPIQESGQTYSAEREMEMLKNGKPDAIANCKLPDLIKESFLKNPIPLGDVDPVMDDFTRRLSEKLPGVSRVENIMEQLDKVDNAKKEERRKTMVNERRGDENPGSVVDYGLIKTIVESVVNAKIGGIRDALNENRQVGSECPT
ncbi:MAG: hypothetical protein J6Y37_13435, partial [Paludibacteraceae bacterium]|nr:hypothetical protein [Paludibacteraceae bacterium]